MTGDELRTLRALTARLLPGPPEDPDPGALEAGAPEAIARLLHAFDEPDPPIHAAWKGGFIPLDPVAELGWRMRIERLAETFSEGLQRLDAVGFAQAPPEVQDELLQAPELADFIALAMTLTLEAVYGPPQYGGNRDLAGWRPLHWPGFTQPDGFTPEQVSAPDTEPPTQGDAHEAITDLRAGLSEEAGWRRKPN